MSGGEDEEEESEEEESELGGAGRILITNPGINNQ